MVRREAGRKEGGRLDGRKVRSWEEGRKAGGRAVMEYISSSALAISITITIAFARRVMGATRLLWRGNYERDNDRSGIHWWQRRRRTTRCPALSFSRACGGVSLPRRRLTG